ncbi:DUF6049 family protein [Kitasatospora sp. GP82]|uniref:DUF6049 family protein n=1 Tax=Kitasatospora sp. GP82 TaxID=3035089 RepID=UPI00247654CF|nr:DUF6049 family protein [Kitasatospora sp. GP82]MDH6127664.1 hypothetical protein [Kitasatospora sp. GP82]
MSEPARHSGLRAYGCTGRVAKRLAALLAGGVALLAAAPPAVAAAPGRTTLSAAAMAPAVSADYPAGVTIDTVTPTVAGQNDTVTITGRVTNSGDSGLKGAHAAVRRPVGERPLSTRSDISQVAGRTTPTSQDGIDLPAPLAEMGNIAPGQTRSFTLQVSPSDLKLNKSGVYELAVDVWDQQGSHALGLARTFLPYSVDPIAKATQVATLWPLTHAPELVAQTMPDNDQVPVLRDDSLATELASGGRLFKLVDIGEKLPGLTWVVDPDLLDTVYAMTKPYRVQKPGTAGESAKDDNTVQGTGRDAAVAWLAKLRQAVTTAGTQVVALPYADPDLASIAHNGAQLDGMDTALRKAGTAGQVTAEGRLSVDVRGNVAWPYQGQLDQQIVGTTRTAGDNLVLVDSASMSDSLNYTPNAARPIGEGQTAVVADHTLSQLFEGDLTSAQARTGATQRFLAETLMITQQQPDTQRNLLVMPPRDLTVGTATALSDALTAAQKGNWVNQVKLETVATATPDPEATTSVQPAGDYPNDLRDSELTGNSLSKTMGLESRLDQLLKILTQPQRVRGPFSAAMVRSMSTEWREQAKAAKAYRTGTQDYLDNLISAVKVPSKKVITLAGDNGTLLVSIKNDLNQSVVNLKLRLTSGQVNRLNVGQPEDVVLDATTSRTLRFPAQAKVNGPVQVTAQLWTTGADPQPYGDPMVFTVQVTSVTQGVLYVIGGGVVLILLAGLRFYLQRKKRAAEPDTDGEPAGPTGPDEQPGGGEPTQAGTQAGTQATAREIGEDTGRNTSEEESKDADSDPAAPEDARNRTSGDEKVGP